MKTDLYTKIILTALTIGVFALVYQQSDADGLSPISVAEAKSKKGSWRCYDYLGNGAGAGASEELNKHKARFVVVAPVGKDKKYQVCYR